MIEAQNKTPDLTTDERQLKALVELMSLNRDMNAALQKILADMQTAPSDTVELDETVGPVL